MAEKFDVTVLGSGMGSLTAACLLAKQGYRVVVAEQNYLPGGCTSSYWRKGFVFESGATTLVGLDENMPLQYLLAQTGICLEAVPLDLPMQVHLSDGRIIYKHRSLEKWIQEAEKHFGVAGQRPFWEFCYRISQFVWQTSLRQTAFPPTSLSDLWQSVKSVTADQLRYAGYSFVSVKSLLEKYGLLKNRVFVDFVNEQLLITAQNYCDEVNVLFGATALCYTNYGNYYINGGLINLVNPLIEYLEKQGSTVLLRHRAEEVTQRQGSYRVRCEVKKTERILESDFLISGLPINNTLQIYKGSYADRYKKHLLESPKLNSAFQVGIGFRRHRNFEAIHHQVHLPVPLPETRSASIFVSLSHPADTSRTENPALMVASVSTHLHDPAQKMNIDKASIVEAILTALEKHDLVRRSDIVYLHASGAKDWQQWTRREYGFVGGYPQYANIKPWQMPDARLDGHRAYLCGDTVYPGQGIPGTVLSGIIAVDKLRRDHR